MKALLLCIASVFFVHGLNGQSADSARPSAGTTWPKVRQYDSIVVSGQKALFQQQPFGTVVNVGSSVLSKGSSALQALERSPGVTIDHRYNSIALNGRSGVTVRRQRFFFPYTRLWLG
jgi:iron complex outermembrane recepter protein